VPSRSEKGRPVRRVPGSDEHDLHASAPVLVLVEDNGTPSRFRSRADTRGDISRWSVRFRGFTQSIDGTDFFASLARARSRGTSARARVRRSCTRSHPSVFSFPVGRREAL
jgi:hypothetical protein